MDRRGLIAIGMVLLVAIAGCAGGGSGGGEAPATTAPEDAEPSGDQSADGSLGVGDGPSLAEASATRYRIKETTYHLNVADFESALGDLRTAVRTNGGYVGSEDFRTHRIETTTWREGTIVLRVPVDQYAAVIGHIEGAGTVTEKTSETIDVTGKVVDLQARLANLRVQRDRLRGLYNRSDTTEETLEIQERLSTVQSDIERLEGKLRTLENRVAYSTVTVHLTEQHPDPETLRAQGPKWYDQRLVVVFLDSVEGALTVSRMLAVFVTGAIPYLVVFGAVAGIGVVVTSVLPSSLSTRIGRLSRRLRRRLPGSDVTEDGNEDRPG